MKFSRCTGLADPLTAAFAAGKALFAIASIAYLCAQQYDTTHSAGTTYALRSLSSNMQTELHKTNHAAWKAGRITEAAYELNRRKIGNYGQELEAVGTALWKKQGEIADRHFLKSGVYLAAHAVFHAGRVEALWKKVVVATPGFGTKQGATWWAGKKIVGTSDIREVLGPLAAKWKEPEDAFVKARVAAKVRCLIDKIRKAKPTTERRREWIANFIGNMERKGWGKALPGVESRKDLKKFLAEEVRKYARLERILSRSGLTKENKHYVEVRRRYLEEMSAWNVRLLSDEDIRARLARIREEVEKGLGSEKEPKGPAPVAIIQCSPLKGRFPLDVRLVGSGSQGKRLSYIWEVDTLGRRTGALVDCTFREVGRYYALLIVKDPHDRISRARTTIVVQNDRGLHLTGEGVECYPKGAVVEEKVKVAAAFTVSGLPPGVVAPLSAEITALGRTQTMDFGMVGNGTHAEAVWFTIPADAEVGSRPVTVNGRLGLPDPVLYAHPDNMTNKPLQGQIFVRDPFLGLWKGRARMTQTHPEQNVSTWVPCEVRITRRDKRTLILTETASNRPMVGTIRDKIVHGVYKEDLVEDKAKFMFDREELRITGSTVNYRRDPDTGAREVDFRGTILMEMKRVWHPGEPKPTK